jgi:hypothetical protein
MALEKGTMFELGEAGDIKEVPIPSTVKESGDVPPGYSVGNYVPTYHRAYNLKYLLYL